MGTNNRITIKHKIIKQWIEERDGIPATIKKTIKDGKPGILSIRFPNTGDKHIVGISWEAFFNKFEEKQMAFLYSEEKTSGESSNFFKFVKRFDKTAVKKMNREHSVHSDINSDTSIPPPNHKTPSHEDFLKNLVYVQSLKFGKKAKLCESVKEKQPFLFNSILILSSLGVPNEMIDHVLCVFLALYISFSKNCSFKSASEQMYGETALRYEQINLKDLKNLPISFLPEKEAISFTIEQLERLPGYDLRNRHSQACVRTILTVLDCLIQVMTE